MREEIREDSTVKMREDRKAEMWSLEGRGWKGEDDDRKGGEQDERGWRK